MEVGCTTLTGDLCGIKLLETSTEIAGKTGGLICCTLIIIMTSNTW